MQHCHSAGAAAVNRLEDNRIPESGNILLGQIAADIVFRCYRNAVFSAGYLEIIFKHEGIQLFPGCKKRQIQPFCSFLGVKKIHIIPGCKKPVNLLLFCKIDNVVHHIGVHISSQVSKLFSLRIGIVVDHNCISTHFLGFFDGRFKMT